MAEGRKINGALKAALEFGPILLFFIGYIKLKDQTFHIMGTDYQGFLVMTALFIPVMIVTTGLLWALTGTLSKMQVATVVLVVVFGGLSVWLNDERFIKMKPTIVNTLFGVVLLGGLAFGTSLLGYVFNAAFQLDAEGWRKLTLNWGLFFVFLAVSNEVVWRLFDTDTWVAFKVWAIMPITVVFSMLQVPGLLDDE